jgi:hypothetical protein
VQHGLAAWQEVNALRFKKSKSKWQEISELIDPGLTLYSKPWAACPTAKTRS